MSYLLPGGAFHVQDSAQDGRLPAAFEVAVTAVVCFSSVCDSLSCPLDVPHVSQALPQRLSVQVVQYLAPKHLPHVPIAVLSGGGSSSSSGGIVFAITRRERDLYNRQSGKPISIIRVGGSQNRPLQLVPFISIHTHNKQCTSATEPTGANCKHTFRSLCFL